MSSRLGLSHNPSLALEPNFVLETAKGYQIFCSYLLEISSVLACIFKLTAKHCVCVCVCAQNHMRKTPLFSFASAICLDKTDPLYLLDIISLVGCAQLARISHFGGLNLVEYPRKCQEPLMELWQARQQ